MDSDPALTPREKEVVDLLRLGFSNKAIAVHLGIGLDTARRHVSRIKRKTGVRSVIALPAGDLPDEPGWLERLDLGGIRLSPAESRVLRLLCQGHGSKQIARVLQVSPRTVDKHREHLLDKCGCKSTRQLVAWIASQYAKCGMANLSGES
ncbi:LuxR family transcriptional regulator [Burkholderia sp. AU18528]|uniref:Response regulator transcription factor n=2 Tax=Burkholderia TaxID=32008 RepID=A0ABW7KZG5_9BURK|nr:MULTISPECIES: helix-turn-helix transcriptional regulator [Burkholderia]MEB2504675.1 helix-turn-helix transcriptional regulator [Burkholderia anthinoferrum]MEB2531220.1 helix-turn-helix transcriptional regulator [Burkholderia anthinoferrum]MEB2565405.1 helix-turn-helix transcriptional regulator [Burkholderia anthinoferrum]MEB2580487.1 helix-turn-helix transcriptional regulator [Burkholderia anthinoferrum]MCA7970034.1 helix-turn-helix transcriptional regulator [Burkholderia sp. AU39826]